MYSVIKKLSTLLLVTTFASSCALLTTPESLDQNINDWLKDHQYDEIDIALNKIDAEDQSYQSVKKRKKNIESKKTTYIQSVSNRAKKLIANKQWQKALDTYDTALERISSEKQLISERNELISARDKEVNELKQGLLLKRARALVSYKKIYEKLNQLIPDDYGAQYDINRYEKDRISLASRLLLYADHLRKNKEFTKARECYWLSNQLQATKYKADWVSKIDRQLKNKADAKRHDDLIKAYKTAFNKGEYNKAKMHLDTLLAINPGHKKAKTYSSALNKTIKQQVDSKIALGKTLYSQKKINEALKLWKQAQQLDPKNEQLILLINRGDKVSKKIESLENQQ